MDKRAQVSVEYLLTLSFTLLVFTIITLLLFLVAKIFSNISSTNIIDKKNRVLEAISE